MIDDKEPPMTMRERIARALCDDTLSRWRSPVAMKAQPWREFLPAADAVLDAMSEPTKGMLDRGITAAESVEDWTKDSYESYRVDSASDLPLPVWQAMITAAKEGA